MENHEIDYKIHGEEMQCVEIDMDPQESVIAEAGGLMYMEDDIKMALFQLCRAVVFPSYLRSEAFGVTLLEGAMCAKPLISAEVGSGTSHINIHQQTGLVVTPGCPASLREAMDYLYYNSRVASEMGERAQARYEELFTGFSMGQRYAEVYSEILAKQGADNKLALEQSE